MKLTPEQMFILQDACTARAEQLLERSHLHAADPASAHYWKQEAAGAHQLSLLFKDAIKVEITTAALENPHDAINAAKTPAPLPQSLAGPASAGPTTPQAPNPRALRLASSLSKRSLQNLVGTRLPDHVLASRCSTILSSRGETEPLDAQDLQAAARYLWKQNGYKPGLPLLNPALEGCQESPAAPLSAPAVTAVPAPHPKEVSDLHSSSAQCGEACGDINCDGACSKASAAQPAHPPALIQLIDVSPTENDARIATANVTTAALRAAARFLRTDMHSLPAVITRRVRERLAKAAA